MAKQLTKTSLSVPPETMAAIDDEERAAALRQTAFEFDAKRRDLETSLRPPSPRCGSISARSSKAWNAGKRPVLRRRRT
jgi:hypothetical protein